MKEEFLHYLWKHRLFDADNFFDCSGNRISVIDPGEYNRDSGPDFFNARITIDGVTWAGNVEIHTFSSHFFIHGHQNDPAYNNIILHVVAGNDREVFDSRGNPVTTALMKFDMRLYEKYISLVNNPKSIACQDETAAAGDMLICHWLEALAIERLESKSGHIEALIRETGSDWEEVLYRLLSRYFGFRVNREPFELLARALPFRIIRKHTDDRFVIEALLYGTAGMLDDGLFREALDDSYFRDLSREYRMLKVKYGLNPLHGWIWKLSRMRPASFPTVRISQLAAMLAVSGGLFSRVIASGSISELRSLFEVEASEYWDCHYVFGKQCRPLVKHAGSQSASLLIVNAVVPLVFVYGRDRGRQDLCERAMAFLADTEAENNKIINEWREAGIKAENALQSQALIELRNEYCSKRRCLECRIGSRLISTGTVLRDSSELILEPGMPGL
jgi:hypothetical protein